MKISREERADFISQAIDRLTIARDEIYHVQSRKVSKHVLAESALKRLEAYRVDLNYMIDELDSLAVAIEVEIAEEENKKNSYRE